MLVRKTRFCNSQSVFVRMLFLRRFCFCPKAVVEAFFVELFLRLSWGFCREFVRISYENAVFFRKLQGSRKAKSGVLRKETAGRLLMMEICREL